VTSLPETPVATARIRWLDALVPLIFFLFFGGLYAAGGWFIGRTGVFAVPNALLEADHWRVIWDMTRPAGLHLRTDAHPLFVILFNPLGSLYARVLGAEITAVALSAAAGAAAVAVSFATFRRAALAPASALLWSLVVAFSASHWFYGATPETWSFAVLGVILVFYLALAKPGRLAWGVPAGVFAGGMLTPNVALAALAFAGGVLRKSSLKKAAARVGLFTLLTVGGIVGLNFVQKALYPGAQLVVLPEIYKTEAEKYVPFYRSHPLTFVGGVERLLNVGKNFLVFNVAGPLTETRYRSVGEHALPLKPYVVPRDALNVPFGWGAALLWLFILGWSVDTMARRRAGFPAAGYAALACILFNLVFYFFYGSTLMIYGISSLFPTVAFAAWGLAPYARPGTKPVNPLNLALGGLVVLEVINNGLFLYGLAQPFRAYPYPLTP
jgi:hypothetical protein